MTLGGADEDGRGFTARGRRATSGEAGSWRCRAWCRRRLREGNGGRMGWDGTGSGFTDLGLKMGRGGGTPGLLLLAGGWIQFELVCRPVLWSRAFEGPDARCPWCCSSLSSSSGRARPPMEGVPAPLGGPVRLGQLPTASMGGIRGPRGLQDSIGERKPPVSPFKLDATEVEVPSLAGNVPP